jgi:hypothetical protein
MRLRNLESSVCWRQRSWRRCQVGVDPQMHSRRGRVEGWDVGRLVNTDEVGEDMSRTSGALEMKDCMVARNARSHDMSFIFPFSRLCVVGVWFAAMVQEKKHWKWISVFWSVPCMR